MTGIQAIPGPGDPDGGDDAEPRAQRRGAPGIAWLGPAGFEPAVDDSQRVIVAPDRDLNQPPELLRLSDDGATLVRERLDVHCPPCLRSDYIVDTERQTEMVEMCALEPPDLSEYLHPSSLTREVADDHIRPRGTERALCLGSR